MTDSKIVCPFCSAPYTREMLKLYNEGYGCDTGCDYYRIRIECASCKETVYVKGDFGVVEKEDVKRYLDEVTDADLIAVIDRKVKSYET